MHCGSYFNFWFEFYFPLFQTLVLYINYHTPKQRNIKSKSRWGLTTLRRPVLGEKQNPSKNQGDWGIFLGNMSHKVLGYCRKKGKFDMFSRMSPNKSREYFKFPGRLKVTHSCCSNNVCWTCHPP